MIVCCSFKKCFGVGIAFLKNYILLANIKNTLAKYCWQSDLVSQKKINKNTSYSAGSAKKNGQMLL